MKISVDSLLPVSARSAAALAAALLLLAGCTVFKSPPAPTAVAPTIVIVAAPTLSAEANAALTAASAAITLASERKTLWIEALAQLEHAKQAARRLDSAATITHANEAIALCELALQQPSAPRVSWSLAGDPQ